MQELIREKERANIIYHSLQNWKKTHKGNPKQAEGRKEGNNKLRTEMHKFELKNPMKPTVDSLKK